MLRIYSLTKFLPGTGKTEPLIRSRTYENTQIYLIGNMEKGKTLSAWIRHGSDNSSPPLTRSINLVSVHIEERLVVLKRPERGTFLLSRKQLHGAKRNVENVTSTQFMHSWFVYTAVK